MFKSQAGTLIKKRKKKIPFYSNKGSRQNLTKVFFLLVISTFKKTCEMNRTICIFSYLSFLKLISPH